MSRLRLHFTRFLKEFDKLLELLVYDEIIRLVGHREIKIESTVSVRQQNELISWTRFINSALLHSHMCALCSVLHAYILLQCIMTGGSFEHSIVILRKNY
jgi:hypothetical protein